MSIFKEAYFLGKPDFLDINGLKAWLQYYIRTEEYDRSPFYDHKKTDPFCVDPYIRKQSIMYARKTLQDLKISWGSYVRERKSVQHMRLSQQKELLKHLSEHDESHELHDEQNHQAEERYELVFRSH